MTNNKIVYKAPALSRGLQVIDFLAQNGKPKSMSELVSELHLSFNQLYRIIACLKNEGYLYQDENRHYFLTDKIVFKHRSLFIEKFSASEICKKLMKEFTWQTNQSCHLAGLRDDNFWVFCHAHPDFSLSISAREGSILNTVKSSSALLFLALANDYDAWKLMRSYRLTPELRLLLIEQINTIREKGYSEIQHDRIIGLTSLSFPVTAVTGYALATITCPYFDHIPGDYSELKERLRRLGQDLSQRLNS
ncbi:hypothetical protein EHN07_03080 [Buttiauxella warmboldiae]|uniref:IclR family transcriptional regulator n=1 Tax=Buttiauxella warmboldiae TaxID=82993 RepID=A0A3N5DWS1_9ENTR|nr:helix-turn-helix domain-containing protein [Buttiauxella warmboldiae]RPH30110.1 hypothetical protein EHN07_03080 [Buttiauxella warmboldiae]